MQITLNIPDNKIAFFMELVTNLGFVKVSDSKSGVLTDEQIQLTEAARKKAKENPEGLVEWEKARQQIDWDGV